MEQKNMERKIIHVDWIMELHTSVQGSAITSPNAEVLQICLCAVSGLLTFSFVKCLQERNKLFYSELGSNFIVIITQYLSMYFFFLTGHQGECENLRFWGLNFFHPIVYNGSDLRCSMGVLLYPLDNSINFDSSDPSGYLN